MSSCSFHQILGATSCALIGRADEDEAPHSHLCTMHTYRLDRTSVQLLYSIFRYTLCSFLSNHPLLHFSFDQFLNYLYYRL